MIIDKRKGKMKGFDSENKKLLAKWWQEWLKQPKLFGFYTIFAITDLGCAYVDVRSLQCF